MIVAAITFSHDFWRVPAAIGSVVGAALILWSYSRSTFRWKWLCAFLKLAGLALLALCLIELRWSQMRVKPGANLMAILADNSSSMAIQDAADSQPRSTRMQELLDPLPASWLTQVQEQFELRRYQYDQRLQAVESFASLTFTGKASAMGSALQSTVQRFAGRPLAGILLFSDGNATDLQSLPDNLEGWPPIYPVMIGGDGPARDLSIKRISVTQTAFEDAPVTLDAEVAARGFEGQSIVGRLTDAAGTVVASEEKEMSSSSTSADFRFQIRSAPPGLAFYQFSVQGSGSAAALPEATPINNQRVVVVDREPGPWRILYVSGRPNWEYKFLNRALASDPQVQLTGLMRVARREPRFSFLGRAGETSNPLFRGTEDQAKGEVAAYDQPVLVRLNPLDEEELRGGFPIEPAALFGYHAIILDDVESAFFTPAQSALVQRFVSERGGGLLMLGGMESFSEGGYARTSIGDTLPVSLDRTAPSATPGPLLFDLDREGWLQPWARLREVESEERSRLAALPPLSVLNRVRGIKPGAGIIATAKDSAGTKAPALVVQRFGRGRSAALLMGDLWRWGMRSPEARTDLEKAWRQLSRWLVSDVPGRVSLTIEPLPSDPAGAMELKVRVTDNTFQPVENATVTLKVEAVTMTPPPGSTAGPSVASSSASPAPPVLSLPTEPSLTEPGTYTASWVPHSTGGFKATATAVNPQGALEGTATTGWTSDLEARELQSLSPNQSLLEALAAKTGGRLLTPASLPEFARTLPMEKAPLMEPQEEPLWHSPWLFLAAVGCFAAEWGLRRTSGLP